MSLMIAMDGRLLQRQDPGQPDLCDCGALKGDHPTIRVDFVPGRFGRYRRRETVACWTWKEPRP